MYVLDFKQPMEQIVSDVYAKGTHAHIMYEATVFDPTVLVYN